MAKKRTRVKTDKAADVLDELRPLLAIDKHNLDEELVAQPQTFQRISEAAIMAQAHRDYCKEEIGRVDADLSARHRRRLEKAGGRATDAAVKSAVDGDPKHQKAVDAHIEARKNADLLNSLKESFHQRSYMLRDLGGLYIANYFERNAIQGGERGKEARANNAIDKMDAKRREVGSRNSARRKKDK